MAAHYEGKESTILDMTGLAQKGGAVWSHIKIYEKNVKTLKAESGGTYDYTFQYQKEFDVTLDSTNGSATLTVSGSETFPYSGTLTETQKQDFICIATAAFSQTSGPSGGTIAAGEYIDLSSSSSTATVTVNSSTSITIDTGDAITSGTGTIRLYVPVQVADGSPIAKSLPLPELSVKSPSNLYQATRLFSCPANIG